MGQRRWIPASHTGAIRSCYNGTGVDIPASRIVRLAAGEGHPIALPAADTDQLFGATMVAIKAGAWGDVLMEGQAVCTSGAAITAHDTLTVDTQGRVVTWAAAGGKAVAGVAINAATAADQLIEVQLAGPNSFGIS